MNPQSTSQTHNPSSPTPESPPKEWSSVQKADNTKLHTDAVAEQLQSVHAKMRAWTQYCEELQAFPELAPALMAGRPDLVRLMQPRAMSEAECRMFIELVAILIATNATLQQHSQLVAELAKQTHNLYQGGINKLLQLQDYANFRNPVEGEGG